MKNKHIQNSKDLLLFKKISKIVQTQIKADSKEIQQQLIFKFIFYLTLTISFYAGIFWVKNPWIFVALFVGYGFLSLLFSFNFAHDFSHNTIFKSKQWNHLGFVFMYTMVGAHAEAWKDRHVHSHHYAPNVQGYDSDLDISSLIRVIPGSEYRWYHKYQHLYAPIAYMSYSFFWVFVKDFVLLFSKEEFSVKKDWKYHLSFWLQKSFYIGYLLIFPLLFSHQAVIIVVTGFILMHLLQSLFLLFTFFITHHVVGMKYPTTDADGKINASWLDNQIGSSNDFYPFSEFANFIFGGFNNHIAHHLFPNINHAYYPSLNKILYKILIEHGIMPNETTFFGGVKNHLLHLKNLSKE